MNEEYEKWENEQWRGAVNAIPRWEGVWNTSTGFLTSAEKAKSRLKEIVLQDRDKCPTGRWFHLLRIIDWDGSLIRAHREMSQGRPVLYRGKEISKEELDRLSKPRYRWRWRR